MLLLAYKIDDEPVELLNLTSQSEILWMCDALCDETITKTAFNAQFERVCLDKYLGVKSVNWDCTMIKAWTLGIAGGLDKVSRALKIPEDAAKLKEGKKLIRMFCKNRTGKDYPYTKAQKPDDWAKFKEYCKRDVEVECFIWSKLSALPYTREQNLYELDQKINHRGIRIDREFAKCAIELDQVLKNNCTTKFNEITGIDSPNQIGELKKWLSDRDKGQITQITKSNKDELFELFKGDEDAITALECRYKTGKTSTAKYHMMIDATGLDGRMRGTLQFYGAQTGRWAGRLLQVQNLPQNHIPDLDTAKELIRHSNYSLFSKLYKDPQDVLSQCIRPAIIPSDGNKFVVADYSAIEARVIAWLAKEDWVLDVFKTTGKIYEATAAKMLGIPVEKIEKGSPERQKGKVATLALGYQGGVGSLTAMGALKMGIPENELQGIVDAWRLSNPKIVNLWYEAQNALKSTVIDRQVNYIGEHVKSFYKSGYVFIELPSGRLLAFPKMTIRESSKFEGMDELVYGVVNTVGKWRPQATYGGRIVENIVQATARDILASAMLKLDKAGYDIVMHVHDEVVIEVPKNDNAALNDIIKIMTTNDKWNQGLPLNADGYECKFYKKD
ncbi:MAG: DNA polymerase [Clostridia bacterium]|nr:DNA polymerase [Clostridia bacterium]